MVRKTSVGVEFGGCGAMILELNHPVFERFDIRCFCLLEIFRDFTRTVLSDLKRVEGDFINLCDVNLIDLR